MRRTQSNERLLAWAAAALIATAVLAGCGDDEGDAEETPAEATPAETTTETATTEAETSATEAAGGAATTQDIVAWTSSTM